VSSDSESDSTRGEQHTRARSDSTRGGTWHDQQVRASACTSGRAAQAQAQAQATPVDDRACSDTRGPSAAAGYEPPPLSVFNGAGRQVACGVCGAGRRPSPPCPFLLGVVGWPTTASPAVPAWAPLLLSQPTQPCQAPNRHRCTAAAAAAGCVLRGSRSRGCCGGGATYR
jgi:hypothetical protein